MWLMAALKDALSGGPALQPIVSEDAPEPQEVPEGTALIIHTSGSTGVPKFVAHSAESIRAGAEATNERLGGAGQWLVALPTHLIAGLQMLTRSVLAGTEPLFFTGSFTPERFIQHAAKLDGIRRYTSLVPVQLSALLEYVENDDVALGVLRRFDAILVGGQAVSLSMRAVAHELGLNLVRTYGMTETGGGVVYDGVEIGDTQVRIRDGEVQLAGSSLALGYAGDADLTREFFIEDGGTRWYRTGDAGSLLGGMLQVTGRLDRVIISGGTNVSLDLVETFIGEQLQQTVATIRLDDATWGERVGLLIEGKPDTGVNDTDFLKERVTSILGPAAVPARTVHCDELPRLANGKPDYRRIAELF